MDIFDLREWLTLVFSVVIVPLGYIFRQARLRIEEKLDRAAEEIKGNGRKIDILDERARTTNGRLTKLETWSTYHQQQDVAWCKDIREELAALRKHLEGRP